MNAEHLLRDVQLLMPNASPFEQLQMAYLISVETESTEASERTGLRQLATEIRSQLQAATEQFLAVADELSRLARFDPCKFSPNQIWSLFRSLNVHRQLLRIYAGRNAFQSPAER
jgi:hypothetical protein